MNTNQTTANVEYTPVYYASQTPACNVCCNIMVHKTIRFGRVNTYHYFVCPSCGHKIVKAVAN